MIEIKLHGSEAPNWGRRHGDRRPNKPAGRKSTVRHAQKNHLETADLLDVRQARLFHSDPYAAVFIVFFLLKLRACESNVRQTEPNPGEAQKHGSRKINEERHRPQCTDAKRNG